MSSAAFTTEVVRPARTVRGSVRLPGNISIRTYATLAVSAHGTSSFANFSPERTT